MLTAGRRTIVNWFENEASFWKLLTFVLGAFALLKGLRPPGTWALTQAELDYRFGFIKRGLSGTVLHAFNIWHARGITVVFSLEFAALVFLLVLFTVRCGLTKQNGGLYITAVFASSYCVTYLIHTIGYSEIPESALVLAVLLVRDTRARFLAALPVTVIGILIHAQFLLIFTPLLLFSFYLDGVFKIADRRRMWAYGSGVAIVAMAVTTAVALRRSLRPDQTLQMQTYILSKVDFPLRTDSFMVLVLSLGSNLRLMLHVYGHSYWWWTEQLVSLGVFGPVLFILLRRCLRTLRSMDQTTTLTVSALCLAAFGPLTMHLLGFDQMRWNSMCVMNAYVCLLLINMRKVGVSLHADSAERTSVILVIALNMASGYGLMDGKTIKPYPYFPAAVKEIVGKHDAAKYAL